MSYFLFSEFYSLICIMRLNWKEGVEELNNSKVCLNFLPHTYNSKKCIKAFAKMYFSAAFFTPIGYHKML